MLTEVMRYYGLARPPIDAGFYETDHHAQVLRDVRAAILGGRLVALTAVIGSGKTILSRRLRAELEREGRVIVSRSLTVEKAKITVPLLISALFYDLTPDKTVTISSQSERRERDLQELFKRAKKPVALFVDDAHDLHPKTLVALKRLTEVVVEGGGQLSVVLLGHPKLKNDLRRPQMEEIGDRTTVFEFGGLRDRQRDYIDWVLKISLDEGCHTRGHHDRRGGNPLGGQAENAVADRPALGACIRGGIRGRRQTYRRDCGRGGAIAADR